MPALVAAYPYSPVASPVQSGWRSYPMRPYKLSSSSSNRQHLADVMAKSIPPLAPSGIVRSVYVLFAGHHGAAIACTSSRPCEHASACISHDARCCTSALLEAASLPMRPCLCRRIVPYQSPFSASSARSRAGVMTYSDTPTPARLCGALNQYLLFRRDTSPRTFLS